MNGKQNRFALNRHERIIDRGLGRIDGEIGRNVAGLAFDTQDARRIGIDPNGAGVGRGDSLRAELQPSVEFEACT